MPLKVRTHTDRPGWFVVDNTADDGDYHCIAPVRWSCNCDAPTPCEHLRCLEAELKASGHYGPGMEWQT